MPRDLTCTAVVLSRLWRHSLRQPAFAYIIPTVMPLGLVLLISQLYGAMASLPGYPIDDMLTWMGAGIVFLAATMGGGFTATILAVDATTGFGDRLRLLAVPSRTIVAGCLLFEAARIVPVAVVLLVASAGLGLEMPGLGALLAMVALVALWAATWNSVFVVAALRTRSTRLALLLLPLFLPFFLSSTIMVPRPLLPDYAQAVLLWNPLDRFVVAVRPWFLDGPVDTGEIAGAVAFASVIISTAALAANRQLAHPRS